MVVGVEGVFEVYLFLVFRESGDLSSTNEEVEGDADIGGHEDEEQPCEGVAGAASFSH